LTPITPRNILRHELIGLEVSVVKSSNPHNIGISGKVVDETRNTLIIDDGSGEKRIAKGHAIFRFRLRDGILIDVEGSHLIGRPEDRVKRRVRRW
jgi:ribonuclease P protein subunit POP4